MNRRGLSPFHWIAALVLLSLALFAGCGGGSAEDTTSEGGAAGSAAANGGEDSEGGGGGKLADSGNGKRPSKKAEGKKSGGSGGAGAPPQAPEGESQGGGSGGESPSGEGKGSGGGSGGHSKSGGNPEKAAYLAYTKRADTLCSKFGVDLKKEALRYAEEIGSIGLAASTIARKVVVPKLSAELARLRTLSVPPVARQASGTLEAAIQSMLDEAREKPKTFVVGGPSVPKSEETARALGFKRCGSLV
jgi:hypothetical protein